MKHYVSNALGNVILTVPVPVANTRPHFIYIKPCEVGIDNWPSFASVALAVMFAIIRFYLAFYVLIHSTRLALAVPPVAVY